MTPFYVGTQSLGLTGYIIIIFSSTLWYLYYNTHTLYTCVRVTGIHHRAKSYTHSITHKLRPSKRDIFILWAHIWVKILEKNKWLYGVERKKKETLDIFCPQFDNKKIGEKKSSERHVCGRKKVKGSRFMDTNTNGRDRDSYTHSTYCGLYRRIWLVVGRVLGFHDRLNFLVFCFLFFTFFDRAPHIMGI